MGKIPGMKGLGQARQLQKLASEQGGFPGGGMPNLGSLGSMFGGMPPMGQGAEASTSNRSIDRDKMRKARKAARQNRKKNRKR